MSDPKWMTVARDYLDTKEIAGAKHNPTIVGFFKRVTGQAYSDETAWCAAFVGNCLLEAGEKSTGALNARSYMNWGVKLDAPRVGCVVVFWRGRKDGWQGHVGFYVGEAGGNVLVLGGNQGNTVSISRYARSKLLGYRWPSTQAVPAASAGPQADVRAVQARLKALGYSEVGKTDGVVGPMTRGAILAFKSDWNDAHLDKPLPLNADRDDAFLAALMVATSRVIATERSVATLKDLRNDGSRTVAATDALKATGTIVGVGGAVGGIVTETGVLDTVTQAGAAAQTVNDALTPLRSLLAFAGDYWWVLAVAAGAGIAFYAGRAAWARLDDHRNARTA